MMRSRGDGFTLIEMLVAMVLMLLLVALMFQAFRTANEVGRKTQAWIEIHQNARSLFDFMERDISGAVLAGRNRKGGSGATDGKYFQVMGDSYKAPDPSGTSKDMSHQRDAIRLLCSTMNPGGARMAEVGYWLQVMDQTDVRKNKVGRYVDYVNDDTEPSPDPTNDDDGDDLTILDEGDGSLTTDVTVWGAYKSLDVVATGVTDLSLEYQETNGDWKDVSSSLTTLVTLPRAVRVTTYITDSRGIFLFLDVDSDSDGKENEEVKREFPFCGSGIKFVHTILVNQEG
jgi:prepilin-type N-terminal cleavage/methylation domain-containing protein